MKKTLCFIIIIIISLSGCKLQAPSDRTVGVQITDSLGNNATLTQNSKVVCCFASFAQCWLLSGGTLAGVTEDALTEHSLDVGNAEIIGTVKHISLEKIALLSPDYVILSADLTSHIALKESFDSMGIACGYFRVDTFGDYKSMMEKFCAVNGNPEAFDKNVTQVEDGINQIKANFQKNDSTALLLRVYSTGFKAKTDNNIAGVILEELGITNIAKTHGSLLENIGLEYIVSCNPTYIFVSFMGSEDGGKAYLNEYLLKNPAFSSLDAVKNGRLHILPKNLFHYKPNNRWDQSYEYIADLLSAGAN